MRGRLLSGHHCQECYCKHEEIWLEDRWYPGQTLICSSFQTWTSTTAGSTAARSRPTSPNPSPSSTQSRYSVRNTVTVMICTDIPTYSDIILPKVTVLQDPTFQKLVTSTLAWSHRCHCRQAHLHYFVLTSTLGQGVLPNRHTYWYSSSLSMFHISSYCLPPCENF